MSAVIAVDFAYTDPWTGEWVAGWRMAWTKQRAAQAHYSRQIRAVKALAQTWTGLRAPKMKITIIRG